MSKRADVFYLEHVRVFQRSECVVYGTDYQRRLQQIVNIPDKNTVFLLLGKGSSITDSAVRKLAESNVIVGFCGSGGAPLHGLVEPVFLTPQDEYRPTQYMQGWASWWFDEERRLDVAKQFQYRRLGWQAAELPRYSDVVIPPDITDTFRREVTGATRVSQILSAEAHYAKALYKTHADAHGMKFSRSPGEGGSGKDTDKVKLANSFLDHGNYLAYGYAAVSLHTLGISYAFPVVHGKTRRGALVFDVADLIKDWLVLPTAFEMAAAKAKPNNFRAAIIDRALKRSVLSEMMNFLKEASKPS